MSASREKRIRQQAKTGGSGTHITAKKKQERQDAFRRAVTIIIASAVLLALIILIVSGSGVMQANMTAVQIGDVKITGAEFDFHYFLSYYQTYSTYESYGLLDYLDLDPNVSFKRQYVAEDETWAQYFEGMAIDSLTRIVAQSEAAKREGIALTQDDINQIDNAIAAAEYSAAQNGVATDRFLRANYGRGITLKSYRAFLERAYLSDRYSATTVDAYQRSEADLEAYYNDNRTDYDFIDYHSFTISGVPADNSDGAYSEEELQTYRDEQRAKADAMLARVTTADAFFALSKEYAPPADEEAAEDSDDAEEGTDGAEDANPDEAEDEETAEDVEADTTQFQKKKASEISETLSPFLLDTERKAGDKTVVEDGDNFLVLLFTDRYRDETNTVNVRHILFNYNDFDTNEAASARAEEIYQEWKDGAATEDSFAELANKYSSDGGSNANGGLYEKVYTGQMVTEFNDWCFDPERKVGDTGIVETSYGFHVMYFIGESNPAFPTWMVLAENDLNNDEYTAHLASLTEALAVKTKWLGMVFSKTKS